MYLVDFFFFFLLCFLVQYLHYYKTSRIFTKQTLGQKLYCWLYVWVFVVFTANIELQFFFISKAFNLTGCNIHKIINKVIEKKKTEIECQSSNWYLVIKSCLSYAYEHKLLYYHVLRRSVFYLLSVVWLYVILFRSGFSLIFLLSLPHYYLFLFLKSFSHIQRHRLNSSEKRNFDKNTRPQILVCSRYSLICCCKLLMFNLYRKQNNNK